MRHKNNGRFVGGPPSGAGAGRAPVAHHGRLRHLHALMPAPERRESNEISPIDFCLARGAELCRRGPDGCVWAVAGLGLASAGRAAPSRCRVTSFACSAQARWCEFMQLTCVARGARPPTCARINLSKPMTARAERIAPLPLGLPLEPVSRLHRTPLGPVFIQKQNQTRAHTHTRGSARVEDLESTRPRRPAPARATKVNS